MHTAYSKRNVWPCTFVACHTPASTHVSCLFLQLQLSNIGGKMPQKSIIKKQTDQVTEMLVNIVKHLENYTPKYTILYILELVETNTG